MQDSSQTKPVTNSLSSSVAEGHDSFVKPARKATVQHLKADSIFKFPSQEKLTVNSQQEKQNPSALSASTETAKPVSFFGEHELKVIHNGPQSLNRTTPDWIFPLLLLLVAAFAWLRTYYNKYFVQIVSAFFNNNLTNQIVRDENILVQRASVLLNIVFNLVAAMFLYFISLHYNWSLGGMSTGFNRYIFFTLLVSTAYTLKFLVLKICGYLFQLNHEMSAYLFNTFLINNVLGIILIPMAALLAFSATVNTQWVIWFSLCLVVAGFIYRIIRGLSVGISSPVFSLYYLFLYLCTLEFAPLLVLIKILKLK